jgi:hypothetical protein
MAIKSIDQRIDQLAIPDGPQQEMPAPIEPVTPDPSLTLEDPQLEPVQVASRIEGLTGILKSVQKATAPVETSPVKRAGKAKEVLAKDASDKPIDDIDVRAAVGEQPIRVEGDMVIAEPVAPATMFRVLESMKIQKVEGKPPTVRPNLDRIQSEDELKQFYLATVDEYSTFVDEQRRLGRTFEDIINDAKEIGDVQILQDLLKRAPGDDPFNDSRSFAARLAVLNLQSATLSAIKQAASTGNAKDILEAGRLMTLDGQASASLLGVTAETGRALAINRIIIGPDKARVRELRKTIESFELEKIGEVSEQEAAAILEQLGGKDKMLAALSSYEQLPNSNARGFYSKHMARAVLDSASEIYQSALVSGVQTHAFNILGSPLHYGMITAERFASALVGKDEALMQSTFASLRAFPRYWSQALSASAEAFKSEKTSDMATKFAQSRLATTAESFNVDPNSTLGKGIDYFGQAMRFMGFRVLTSADEGYKALFRGMEMEFAATDAASKAAIKAVENGASQADATKVAQDVYRATMNSDAAFEEASEMARVITFQDALEGKILGKMQEVMSHPVAKLAGFPFFKTVTQIGLRGLERSPMAIAMPRFFKAMNSADPRERNMALAKVGVSSAIASTFMTVDFWTEGEFRMTGYGPSDPKQRREWLAKNEPYSFGIRQKDGSYRWLSYKRYEPVGMALGSMADARDTVSHIDEPEAAENILMHVALSNLQYMTESQPALQFFAEIANTIGTRYEGEDDKFERILQLLQKQATEASLVVGQSAATLGVAPVGITNTIEKIMENPIKSKMPENQYAYAEIPGYRMSLRGAYEAIAEARAKASYFTGRGIRETNDWYEPVYREFDEWSSVANALPMQVKTKRYNAINEEMIKLKSGFPPISKSMNEPGIKLNDIQFDRYKELINYPERSAFAKEYFGIFLPKPILEQMVSTIADKETYDFSYDPNTGVRRPATPGDRARALQNVRAVYSSYAKDLMLLEFPELKTLVDERKAFEDAFGKAPQKLPLTPDTLEKIKQAPYNPR